MSTATIGHVTRERDEQIITGDRELVGQMRRIQFAIGDQALEIEPMQPVGGLVRPLAKSRSASSCTTFRPPLGWSPLHRARPQETVCCLSFPAPTPGSSGIRPCTAKTGR